MGYFATSDLRPKGDLTSENRVWEIFSDARKSRLENSRKSLKTSRGNAPSPTKTASGRTYWPSRDPIEEEGGINVYAFCYNSIYNWFDFIGREPIQIERHGAGTGDRAKSNERQRRICMIRRNAKLGEFLGDPIVSCFTQPNGKGSEGWYRHCVNSCRLQHRIGIGWITGGIARGRGGDFPWQDDCDPVDVDANRAGIEIANEDWAGSCEIRCRKKFYEKLKEECCAVEGLTMFKKDDKNCCESKKIIRDN